MPQGGANHSLCADWINEVNATLCSVLSG